MAAAKPRGKKKKQVVNDGVRRFTKTQKFLLVFFALLIPSIIFIFIPISCRKHFIKTLKISEEIFLSPPEKINLISTADVGPIYRVVINDYSFPIPHKITPSKIGFNEAEFRIKSRSEGRFIYVKAEKTTRKMMFNSQGVTKWFLPTEARKFLPMILNSDWHPFRLMFKAQFFASEGITSKIFTSKWDKDHNGYILPASGNEGYLGRIFRISNPGTVEFLMSDSVIPVTLRDWVNLAMKINTPTPEDFVVEDKDEEEANNNVMISVDQMIKQALIEEKQGETLGICLNEFYSDPSQNPEWLIPVAMIMEERGFFPEVLDLVQEYRSAFTEGSPYLKAWDELVDKAVNESVAIEIDPQRDLKEVNVYCKNITNLDIDQVRLRIEVTSNLGTKQSFSVPLFANSSLRSREEKRIEVKCPADISIADAAQISHRVESLVYAK